MRIILFFYVSDVEEHINIFDSMTAFGVLWMKFFFGMIVMNDENADWTKWTMGYVRVMQNMAANGARIYGART